MSNKRLEKYRQEANKLRETEENNQSDLQKQHTIKKELPHTPPNDERWEVYRAIYGRNVGLLWLLPLSFSVLFFYSKDPYFSFYGILGLSAIPLSRWLYLIFQLRLGFPRFRKWRRNLPFELEGWESLVDSPHFTKRTYWRLEGAILIDFQPTETFTQQDLEDVLYIFCKKADRAFYPAASVLAGFAGDPRKKWQTTNNVAKGSINNQVVFHIHQFLAYDLASLVKEHHNRVKVTLKADVRECKIDFEDTDS